MHTIQRPSKVKKILLERLEFANSILNHKVEPNDLDWAYLRGYAEILKQEIK